MLNQKLLIVSGTHGNELNPIMAVEKFRNLTLANESNYFEFILGNPLAYEKGLRYIDEDLNRSFSSGNPKNKDLYEVQRAKQILNEYGPDSPRAIQIVLDLHTTTSSMGTSIVMYGRRKKDFYLAAILQNKFGLPIYLHEKDSKQTGFLVEAWPCGLVIEIGPVAQNHYDPLIVERFLIILNFLEDLLDGISNNKFLLPEEITIFVHKGSIDYPRDKDGKINSLIHPERVMQDWIEIRNGDPLFLNEFNKNICYVSQESVHPVFIGEAAYKEKNIAMSFTKKERIKFSRESLIDFMQN